VFVADAPPGFEPTLNVEHDEHRCCTRAEAIALLRCPDVGEALEALWRQAN
jgi:hypothetical protein